MQFKRSLSLLLFLAVLSVPALSAGEGNLHIGSLEIHPYISTNETYSDNIYYAATDKKHDYITTIMPGLKLLFPFRDHKIGAEYNKIFTKYARYYQENTTDENANGFMDFKFGRSLGLTLQDVYAKGHEPRSTSTTGLIEKYTANTAFASASYQLADVSKVKVDYSRSTLEFKSSDSKFRDRGEDLISAYLYYRILPKTSAFVEYDYKQVDFDQSTSTLNNKVNSGLLGVTWEITEKSKGTVKGGYTWKNFESQAHKDFKTWVASIDLNHEFSDYTSLRLVGQRVVNETTLLDARYFATTGMYGEFTHKFTYKIAGVLKGSYGEDKFSDAVDPETKVRKDIVTAGGAGLKYQMRDWLEFAIDYNHRERNSNIDRIDYKENAYMVTINFAM